jgi:hypothetical protein
MKNITIIIFGVDVTYCSSTLYNLDIRVLKIVCRIWEHSNWPKAIVIPGHNL